MATKKPSIIFVPGAWHTASTWDKVTSHLRTKGYETTSTTLPSTTGSASATLADDITAVRGAIIAETARGLDVAVVVHSYGGLVGASAIKGLTKKSPKEDIPSDKGTGFVIGLIMIATGFCQTGSSFIDGLGGKPPPLWRIDDSGFAVLQGDPRQSFYHDLPIEEGEHWVSKLTKQSLKPIMEGGKDVYSGWLEVPCWYLQTTDDHTFPLEPQKMFAQMAKDAGAVVTSREIASSHSPMLSKPQETTDFILDAVATFTK